MKSQQVSLDQSILVAIEATKRTFHTSLLLDDDVNVILSQADIDADESRDGDGEYSQHRHIKLDLAVKEPLETGWLSLSAECEVSEKDGLWVPRLVKIWRVGTEWKRSAIYWENGVTEIRAGDLPLIFAPLQKN